MTRKFLAILLSAALAVTTVGAAPARANHKDDLARALIGATALVIIGSAIHQSHKKKHYGQPTKKTHYYGNKGHGGQHYGGHKKKHVAKVVPGKCFRKFHTNHGWKRWISNYCLKNNMTYRAYSKLPQHCKKVIWTHKGKRSVFSPRCLRHKGWTIARAY